MFVFVYGENVCACVHVVHGGGGKACAGVGRCVSVCMCARWGRGGMCRCGEVCVHVHMWCVVGEGKLEQVWGGVTCVVGEGEHMQVWRRVRMCAGFLV